MTRDNLLGIAKKFQLSPGWQAQASGTELVDFIRDRIRIKPAEVQMQSQTRKDAIAFTVGFDYEQPQIAMKVANELVTMILNEDVRSRTEFAIETSKFMAQEVKRLEAQLSSINTKISELKRSHARASTTRLNRMTQYCRMRNCRMTQKRSLRSKRNFLSRVRAFQTHIPILRRSNERSRH